MINEEINNFVKKVFKEKGELVLYSCLFEYLINKNRSNDFMLSFDKVLEKSIVKCIMKVVPQGED